MSGNRCAFSCQKASPDLGWPVSSAPSAEAAALQRFTTRSSDAVETTRRVSFRKCSREPGKTFAVGTRVKIGHRDPRTGIVSR